MIPRFACLQLINCNKRGLFLCLFSAHVVLPSSRFFVRIGQEPMDGGGILLIVSSSDLCMLHQFLISLTCFEKLIQSSLKLKDHAEPEMFPLHPFLLLQSFLRYMTTVCIWSYSLLRFQGPI